MQLAAKSSAGAHEQTTMNYPDPEHNPICQCYPNMMSCMFCPYGHMLECHYPMTCEEAECDHYQIETNEYDDYSDNPDEELP